MADEPVLGGSDGTPVAIPRTTSDVEPDRDADPLYGPPEFRRLVSQWSGPLPPPSILSGYEDLYPGAAKLVIHRMIDEGDTRRKIERTKVAATVRDMRMSRAERRLGQHYAFIIGMFVVAVGGACILANHGIAGGTLSVGGVVSLVTVFVTGKAVPAKGRKRPRSGVGAAGTLPVTRSDSTDVTPPAD